MALKAKIRTLNWILNRFWRIEVLCECSGVLERRRAAAFDTCWSQWRRDWFNPAYRANKLMNVCMAFSRSAWDKKGFILARSLRWKKLAFTTGLTCLSKSTVKSDSQDLYTSGNCGLDEPKKAVLWGEYGLKMMSVLLSLKLKKYCESQVLISLMQLRWQSNVIGTFILQEGILEYHLYTSGI